MLTPEQVKDKLQDRNLVVVAEVSGIHINTIRKLHKGTATSPSYGTMEKISAYFENQEDSE